jgi:hypothetical protein
MGPKLGPITYELGTIGHQVTEDTHITLIPIYNINMSKYPNDYFQTFLDSVSSWCEYSFIINKQGKGEGKIKWLKPTTLEQIEFEDIRRITEKAEATFEENLFKYALPLLIPWYYTYNCKAVKDLNKYIKDNYEKL